MARPKPPELLTKVDSKASVLHSLGMSRMSTPVNTSAAMAAVWDAVKLLSGPNGLHADDHLSRLEVIAEAQRTLEAALEVELQAASAAGASVAELGAVLGVSRQAAHKRLKRGQA